jgi:hypothetical protein
VRAFVRVEVRTPRDPGEDCNDESEEDEQDQTDPAHGAALALRLSVARDGAERTGRQDGLAVAVSDRYPADSSLKRCPHPKKRERLPALADTMLADYAASSITSQAVLP